MVTRIAAPARPGRPWTLRLLLSVAIVGIVLLVLAGSMAVDYVREYGLRSMELMVLLREEAAELQLTRRGMSDLPTFARHINEFCGSVSQSISPGHHILLLDRDGALLASTRQQSGPEIEQALLNAPPGQSFIPVNEHRLAQVRLTDDRDGRTLVVAEFMDHTQWVLRQQLTDRAVMAGGMAVVLTVLIFLVMDRWVLQPFGALKRSAQAWSQRQFSYRAPLVGPHESRQLTQEFNAMARELERYERQRTAELEKARRIQVDLLPKHPPATAGLTVAWAYRPAQHVAGDLYDVFALDGGRTALAIFDVCGHGIAAALLTGLVKMSLHWRLAGNPDLGAAMGQVNLDLCDCVGDDQFVTAAVGVWDPLDKSWTCCAAGQSGGILLSGQSFRQLGSTGPLLGVERQAQWQTLRLNLQGGDRLVLYTDGVIDAGQPDTPLGLAGLTRLCLDLRHLSLTQQLEQIINQAASRATGQISDDMTLLAVEAQAC